MVYMGAEPLEPLISCRFVNITIVVDAGLQASVQAVLQASVQASICEVP